MKAGLFHVRVYLTKCFAVIFLTSIRFSVSALSNGQTCYIDEYNARGYFKKYDSLTEHEFDNFLANDIPLGLCKALEDKNHMLPSLSDLHQNIIGEGSHRRLFSSLRLKFQRETKHALTAHSCKIVLVRRLPSGVFADPFELQHLVQRGVFADAAVFGDTNLELPSFRSNQSVIEIHVSIATLRDADELEVDLEVPLHARYQPLGHGYARVDFGAPDMFLCCSSEGDVRKTRCQSHILEKKANPVTWEIPCGKKEHAGVVSAITFEFAIVTALVIVSTSISYSSSERKS